LGNWVFLNMNHKKEIVDQGFSFADWMENPETAKRLDEIFVNEQIKEMKARGFITYKNDLCLEEDQFIQEMKDGRKFLVSLEPSERTYTTIKPV